MAVRGGSGGGRWFAPIAGPSSDDDNDDTFKAATSYLHAVNSEAKKLASVAPSQLSLGTMRVASTASTSSLLASLLKGAGTLRPPSLPPSLMPLPAYVQFTADNFALMQRRILTHRRRGGATTPHRRGLPGAGTTNGSPECHPGNLGDATTTTFNGADRNAVLRHLASQMQQPPPESCAGPASPVCPPNTVLRPPCASFLSGMDFAAAAAFLQVTGGALVRCGLPAPSAFASLQPHVAALSSAPSLLSAAADGPTRPSSDSDDGDEDEDQTSAAAVGRKRSRTAGVDNSHSLSMADSTVVLRGWERWTQATPDHAQQLPLAQAVSFTDFAVRKRGALWFIASLACADTPLDPECESVVFSVLRSSCAVLRVLGANNARVALDFCRTPAADGEGTCGHRGGDHHTTAAATATVTETTTTTTAPLQWVGDVERADVLALLSLVIVCGKLFKQADASVMAL